jgi:thiol-disulfide isomerase/thioredoxin
MDGLAWLTDADAAFAQARAAGKHLFLYWGAAWCPPCNRTKATVFQQPHFAEVTCDTVLLHIDGDAPGAQRLGDRFGLRSYPTLVVYRPDGSEVTRLPCEVDGPRFLSLLALALHTPSSAAAALAKAGSGAALSEEEWTLLAWYSWDTDEGRLLAGRDLATTLARLADVCPIARLRPRFVILAQARTHGELIESFLADPAQIRDHLDLVLNHAVDQVRAAPATAAKWSAALERIEHDLTLNLIDRLQALRTRVRLARLGGPQVDPAHARARVETARLVAAEPAMRHAVINTAAGIYSDGGQLDEAEDVLVSELPRSHAPYYFMHNLATIAKKRNDIGAAQAWYERAWKEAVGPATRTQWGVTYLLALAGSPLAAAVRGRILAEATDPDAQRNRIQLAKLA